MRSFLRKLIALGTSKGLPQHIEIRIRLTNQLALLFMCLILPFAIFHIFVIPQLVYLPVIGLLICVIILVLNSFLFINESRILISIVGLVLAGLYHAYLIKPEGDRIIGMTIIEVAFVVVPFLVFDLREKDRLSIIFILSILTFILILPLSDYFNILADTSIFYTPQVEFWIIMVGVVMTSGELLLLSQLNWKSATNAETLIAEMEVKNQELDGSKREMERFIEDINQRNHEASNRTWITEGLAKFARLTRQQSKSKNLYDNIISELVKYLEIQQGGIYLRKTSAENIKTIKLIASFAYGRKKYIEYEAEEGVDLVGQAIIDAETIYLEEVPENYFEIRSGLGASSPKFLLLVPLKFNEHVVGAFELASFNPFLPHQQGFIARLGESIAALVIGLDTNEKTQKLLDQTQEQALELKAREEEMRQNMEELEVAQESIQNARKRAEEENKAKEQIIHKMNSSKNNLKKKLEVTQSELQEKETAFDELKKQLEEKENELVQLREKLSDKN